MGNSAASPGPLLVSATGMATAPVSSEEDSVVAEYVSEDCLSVIDEGETVGRVNQSDRIVEMSLEVRTV